MERGRPLPFGGALAVPRQRMFERIYFTVQTLQPATSAICSAVKKFVMIISLIKLREASPEAGRSSTDRLEASRPPKSANLG
jgi:hypothetical protein